MKLQHFSIASIFALMPILVAAQDQHAEEPASSSSSSRSISRPSPEKRPGDYARYRADFETLCKAFETDGRLEFISSTLVSVFEYDRECIDCRPLLTIFAAACKPKHMPASPTPTPAGDDSNTETTVQSSSKEKLAARLPTLATDDLLLDLMRRMAANEEHAAETLKAVDKFSAALLKPDGRTVAEREYAEALVAFMQAPFSEIRADEEREKRELAKEAGVHNQSSEQSQGTAGLFDP